MVNLNEMASWKKFKNRFSLNEVKVRPVSNQKELGERTQIGVGIEINGTEVILNDIQTKELICYLVNINT